MAQATTRHFTMTIQELTRIAGDISSKAQSLEKRIKGWNLICGLFSEPRSTEEDLAHAYAAEAREVCLTAMRICYAWGWPDSKETSSAFIAWVTSLPDCMSVRCGFLTCAVRRFRPANLLT